MTRRGVDDTQMAGRLGVKRETFNRYRNHQNRINTTIIGQIADALDMDPVDLYRPPGLVSVSVPEELRETAMGMISLLTKRAG